MTTSLRITLIGGPTALIELGGFRFLTDPTFDGRKVRADQSYQSRRNTIEAIQPVNSAMAAVARP